MKCENIAARVMVRHHLVCGGSVNLKRNINIGILAVFCKPVDSVLQRLIACEPETFFGTHFGKAHLNELRHDFLVHQLRHALLGPGLSGFCEIRQPKAVSLCLTRWRAVGAGSRSDRACHYASTRLCVGNRIVGQRRNAFANAKSRAVLAGASRDAGS